MDHRIQSYQKQEICQEKILKPSLSGNWIIIGQPILAGKNSLSSYTIYQLMGKNELPLWGEIWLNWAELL